jgi:hypothetical protein
LLGLDLDLGLLYSEGGNSLRLRLGFVLSGVGLYFYCFTLSHEIIRGLTGQ